MPRIEIDRQISGEICHYYDHSNEGFVVSKGAIFSGKINNVTFSFTLPVSFFNKLLSKNRIISRLSRRDKSCCVVNQEGNGLVIVYLGYIYYFDLLKKKILTVGKLSAGRNPLHLSISVNDQGIIFGEYHSNKLSLPIKVWQSIDGGLSWTVIHEIYGVRHVHGVYADPFTGDLWISTGDFDGQCYIFQIFSGNFSCIRRHGDGTQIWRAVSIGFTEKHIFWGMDSPLVTPSVIYYCRYSETLSFGIRLPGPVWYLKRLEGGGYLLGTSVEPGPAVKTNEAHIYFSSNGYDWCRVGSFTKDALNGPLFKFGVIGFAEGSQTTSDFVIFGEALNHLDGKIFKARLV